MDDDVDVMSASEEYDGEDNDNEWEGIWGSIEDLVWVTVVLNEEVE
jgi:hypothetical protein